MSICATVGRPIQTDIDTCIHDGFVALEECRVDQDLLYYILERLEPSWSELGQTGSQMNLNTGIINPTPVLIPESAEEQRAISEALSDADALIESLERLIAKKRAIKQGAMQDLLSGKRRLPGFTGEWQKRQVSELGTWSSGGTPSKKRPALWEGDIPWVSPKDMKRMRLHDAEDHVSTSADGDGTRFVAPSTVLIVVRGMILARRVPVARAEVQVAFNQDIKALAVNRHHFDSDFVLWWFAANERRLLDKTTESTHGTKRLESTELFEMQFDRPSLEEQRAIATVLTDMDNELDALSTQLAKAHDIKRGMMQQLLTGRIRLV